MEIVLPLRKPLLNIIPSDLRHVAEGVFERQGLDGGGPQITEGKPGKRG